MTSTTDTDEVATEARRGTELDTYLRGTVAVFSLTAAAIHFGFAPAHLTEDWAHGWFFLAIGWFQAAFAVLLVTRPRRWVWAMGLVVNLGIIITWSVSRTAGLPFGPEALRKEAATTPDIICTLIEAGIVLGAAVALLFPKMLERSVLERSFARILTTTTAVIVVVAGSLSLTPAYAGEHSHSHEAGAADGHDHSAAAATLDGTSDCEKSGPPASPGQVALDAEGHDHRGPALQEPLTRDERIQLEAQQAQARTVIERYPTVADAEAAGYGQSTAYVPCIGAHYTNVGHVIGFDPANPSELLYDGTTPDAKLVGLSFLVLHPGGAPDGFAGPNDRWHQHNVNGGLCFGKGGVIGAESMSQEECKAIGGQKRELTDIWMVHDWIVPGWECSWGVFAGECPDLGGRTGGSAWDAPDPNVTGIVAPS